MKPRRIQFALAVMLVACTGSVWPQSGGDLPLGDVARNIRKAKVATKPAEVHVDNDNFSKVMEDAESRRMASYPLQLSLGLGPGAPAPFASPDVTCSLSFTAHGLRLSDVLGAPPEKAKEKDKQQEDKSKEKQSAVGGSGTDLPITELAKLEGPATIVGDSFQLSVFNGTDWEIQEITVGLTVLRHPSHVSTTVAAAYDSARVVPVSSVQIVAKRSDPMHLYHFKGTAAPNSRATFSQALGIALSPEQEWHWAIIDAKGTPPKSN